MQLEDFKNQNKLFGNPVAVKATGKKILAVWSESYGMKIKNFNFLSYTCSV